MSKTINEVMTSAEVRSLWGVSADQMTSLLSRDGRVAFVPGKEIRLAKGADETKGRWLITRAAAERLFGFQKSGERDGEPMTNVDLYSVLTRKEAMSLWDLTLMQMRWAEDRLFKDGEYRKSNRVTLVTKKAMERVFGEQVNPQVNQEEVTAAMLAGAAVETQDIEQRMSTLFEASKMQAGAIVWMSIVALLTPFAPAFSRLRNKHQAEQSVIEEAAKRITAIFAETVAEGGNFDDVAEKIKRLK